MKLAELKSEFHTLIDKIDDAEIIELFYEAMNQSIQPVGSIWKSLTPVQQQGVLDAYEDSQDDTKLIPLSVIKEKYKEWPLK